MPHKKGIFIKSPHMRAAFSFFQQHSNILANVGMLCNSELQLTAIQYF